MLYLWCKQNDKKGTMKKCKCRKHKFVNAYTLELAVKAMEYVKSEKLENKKPIFNTNAKF